VPYKAEKEFAFSSFDVLTVYSPRAYPSMGMAAVAIRLVVIVPPQSRRLYGNCGIKWCDFKA
jgi:hypothetical protein